MIPKLTKLIMVRSLLNCLAMDWLYLRAKNIKYSVDMKVGLKPESGYNNLNFKLAIKYYCAGNLPNSFPSFFVLTNGI